MTRLPFGKYKGQLFSSIPPSYLAWMLETIEDRPALLAEAWVGLADWMECHEAASGSVRGGMPAPTQKLELVIRSWHREQSLKHHPDHGGSPAVMVALNNLADSLRNALEVA